MTAATLVPPPRPAQIVARPVLLETAFDDPDAVFDLIDARSPYTPIYSAEGYEKAGGTEPWFRDHWYRAGHALVHEARPFLENPRFAEATRQAFDAEVVRPRAIYLNISAPMQAGRPHLDICRYRGIDDAYPLWLQVALHHSMLFMPWTVLQSTALTWFYRGQGGGYQYWPDGPDKPSQTVSSPLWNTALVTDNDFMFHRAEGVGPREAWIAPGELKGDVTINRQSDGDWRIDDRSGPRFTFAPEDLRFFVIWKALVFRTPADAAAYDNHTDDLTPEQVWATFARDFRERGERLDIPADPLRDAGFREQILAAYPPPGQRWFPEARRVADRYSPQT